MRRLAGDLRENFQPQQGTASPQWRRNCCTYGYFWLFSSSLQCEGIVYYILGSWWYGLVFTKKDSRTGPPNAARILTGRDPWHSPQDLMLGKSMIVHSKQKYSYQRGKPHLQVQHMFSKNREDCRRGAASLAAWKEEASHFPFMKEPGSLGPEHFQTGCAENEATMKTAGPWIPNLDVNIYNTDRKAHISSSHCSLPNAGTLGYT